MTARRRRTLGALAVTSILALTGCGSLHPGVAAEVGSQSISHGDVDELAQALCAANVSSQQAQGHAEPDLPSQGARTSALQILLDTDLATQFGKSRGAETDPALAESARAQNERGVQLVPPDLRPGFRADLKAYADSQLLLIDVGEKSLSSRGSATPDKSKALAEGHRLLSRWSQHVDVQVDPRFGTFRNGSITHGDSSLSVAESAKALAASRSNSSAGYAAGLPGSQKCS